MRAVTEDGAEVEADLCVIAVPARVTGAISFEPALPSAVAAALEGIVYGQAAKLLVPLPAAVEPSAVLSVPERYWCWTATGGGGRPMPLVSCFSGSEPALEGLGVAGGPGRWLESLGRLRPELELVSAEAVLARWDDDPWAGAAYSVAPEPDLVAALRRAAGTARLRRRAPRRPLPRPHGGSARSGQEAADRLLAQAA